MIAFARQGSRGYSILSDQKKWEYWLTNLGFFKSYLTAAVLQTVWMFFFSRATGASFHLARLPSVTRLQLSMRLAIGIFKDPEGRP